jgi:glutathione S-transferase
MLTFYYFHPACSMAAHIVLEESGIAFQPRRVDMENADDVAELRKANPRGTVPALLVDGRGLAENIAIMTYAASLAPQAGLIPEEALARAECMSLLSWSASTVHINFRQSRRPEKFTSDPAAQEAVRANGRRVFWDSLQAIDARLKDRPWMMGDRFTAPDAYALKFYEWGLISKQPVHELGALTAFKDRMVARPAVRRVLEREGGPLLV